MDSNLSNNISNNVSSNVSNNISNDNYPIIEEIEKSESESYSFKIVVVGDSAVGKSNILSKYINNQFNKESKSTVGMELCTKLYKIHYRDETNVNSSLNCNETNVKVHLWDTAGQEKYQSITSAFYKGAKGAMIVFDITRKDTFDNIDKWYKEIRLMCDTNLVILLIGNKSDLKLLRQVDYNVSLEKAKTMNIGFIETSALDNSNIEQAFKKIILEIYLETIQNNLKINPSRNGINFNTDNTLFNCESKNLFQSKSKSFNDNFKFNTAYTEECNNTNYCGDNFCQNKKCSC